MKQMTPRARALLQAITNRRQLPPVQRLGLLRSLIENTVGAPGHQGFVDEARRIELQAQLTMTPQQLHWANLYAERSRLEWNDHATRAQAADLEESSFQRVEDAVREMTTGMLGQSKGISHDQLRAIRSGAEIPREHRPRISQARLDAEWRKNTRHLDPAGKGWDEKEAVRRLDALADAPPDKFDSIAKQYRGGSAILKKEAEHWYEKRIGYGLMKKRKDRDLQRGNERPDTHEPTNRDRRRAAVVDAYLKTTADSMEADMYRGGTEVINDFDEAVPSHLLNETHEGKPTRRAYLAHALAQAEANGEEG